MDETEEEGQLADRIVVGIDGSGPSKAALAWAAREAKLTGLRLTAVAAWSFPTSWGWTPPPLSDYDPEQDATHMLAQTIDEVLGPDPGIELETMVVEGHPAQVLVHQSESARLVVVGSRGHGAFAGMLLGSVSEFLTAHSHCPVVVVR